MSLPFFWLSGYLRRTTLPSMIGLSAFLTLTVPTPADATPVLETQQTAPLTSIGKQEDDRLAQQAAIEAVINSSFAALNQEDVAGYMATIDETSPLYQSTQEGLEQLFALYDLNFQLDSIEILEATGNQATVRITQTTRKLSGPEFNDNQLVGVHTMTLRDGQWYFFATKIESIIMLSQ